MHIKCIYNAVFAALFVLLFFAHFDGKEIRMNQKRLYSILTQTIYNGKYDQFKCMKAEGLASYKPKI